MPHRTPCTSRAWARFGALNALVGLLVGLHLTLTSTGGGFWMFMLAARVCVLARQQASAEAALEPYGAYPPAVAELRAT